MAEKDPVLFPAATETDAGTVNDPLLLERATVPPPVFVRVTVQALTPALPRVAGAQATEVTAAGGTSAIDAGREDPFNEAVTVAVCSLPIMPAVAVNVAVVPPEATDTEAGTVSDPVLLASATVPPPVRERVTVQALDPPELNDDGAQLKPDIVGRTTDVTVPPVPDSGNACPSGEAAIVSITPKATVAPAEGDRFTLMTATTPFWIVFAFNPARMHL